MAGDAARLAALLAAAWTAFDATAATAPAELRKGPRGGGRDTAQIIEHVVGAEAMYARKMGLPQHIVAALGDPTGLLPPPKGHPADRGPPDGLARARPPLGDRGQERRSLTGTGRRPRSLRMNRSYRLRNRCDGGHNAKPAYAVRMRYPSLEPP